jgi:hypothetical protein
MPYAISEQTAQKLKQLIDDKPGSMVGNGGHVFASRIAGFVKIVADETGGIYPATIQVYDVPEAVWKTKDDCLVLEANEKKLTVGERYIAVRYGMNSVELKSVWVVGVSLPDVGCGLWYDEDDDNRLKVYTPDIAGQGLNHDDTYCQLYIDPGCGITLEGGKKVGVQAGALAGEGLIARTGCKLDVLYGCGLTIGEDEDTLKVYTPDIAGQGLNASEDGCQLYIDPGCGITLEGGKKVGVHADSLAGTCLVKEGDCKLGIDLTEQDGPVFSAVTAVNLYGNCYGIYLNWAVTPFSFKTNPCGLFLGFEAGEAFSSSTYVPLGCCCDDPPPPPPACESAPQWLTMSVSPSCGIPTGAMTASKSGSSWTWGATTGCGQPDENGLRGWQAVLSCDNGVWTLTTTDGQNLTVTPNLDPFFLQHTWTPPAGECCEGTQVTLTITE